MCSRIKYVCISVVVDIFIPRSRALLSLSVASVADAPFTLFYTGSTLAPQAKILTLISAYRYLSECDPRRPSPFRVRNTLCCLTYLISSTDFPSPILKLISRSASQTPTSCSAIPATSSLANAERYRRQIP